ncbi:MAG: mechanosensitive ion channel family protein [Flavobacteriaceae bacterium]
MLPAHWVPICQFGDASAGLSFQRDIQGADRIVDFPINVPTIRKWVKRLRTPIALAIAAVVLWLLTETVLFSDYWYTGLILFVRLLLVIAAGWSLTVLGDTLLRRRLSRLKLEVEDNLRARMAATKLDVLRRIWVVVGGLATLAAALTVVPWARQIGISLFASAGIAGIAIGLAARPVLSNLLAGLQIAFTQPIRIDDAVVVEGEWGWIEEIGLFYVVIKVWDWRRLVVPLSYFIEKPFQNWTRTSASIIGSVFWHVDYHAPVDAIRTKLEEICRETDLWDGAVVNLQVVETTETTMQLRALASARTSPRAWDLRCLIREEMVAWLQREHPEALPRLRAEMDMPSMDAMSPLTAGPRHPR